MLRKSPFPKFRKFEDLEDPFNPGNKLNLYISVHDSNDLYGALWIDSVNGIETGQLLYMTPKLHYPFEKGDETKRKYNFPEYEKIQIFEKYDGTNIVAFKYHDSTGNQFVSYKTRGSPFVRNNKYNKFYDLWCKILIKYPDIPKLVKSERSLSFEIFGKSNRILINYDFPIDIKLLFLIDPQHGKIRSPLSLEIPENTLFPKVAKLYAVFNKGENLPHKYEEMQKNIQKDLERQNKGIKPVKDEKELKKMRSKLLEKGMKGVEGSIWYVKISPSEDIWKMFKCKPEIVEQIHWNVGSISTFGIYTTCINALDEMDVLNYETILPFLLEEYNLQDVEAMKDIVKRVIAKIQFEIDFTAKVVEKYEEIKEKIQSTEKILVMREISQFFAKNQMQSVYNSLVREGILK